MRHVCSQQKWDNSGLSVNGHSEAVALLPDAFIIVHAWFYCPDLHLLSSLRYIEMSACVNIIGRDIAESLVVAMVVAVLDEFLYLFL